MIWRTLSGQENLIPANSTISDAIACMNTAKAKIGVLVSDQLKLLGTFTDGDLRRALAHGARLDELVKPYANLNPKFFYAEEKVPVASNNRSVTDGVSVFPILDKEHKIVGLAELINPALEHKSNVVVLMAGGLGSRMGPLTEDRPKPMLNIGNKPVLQIVLESFIAHGFRQFIFAVNYKAIQIEEYFQSGKDWNVDISFVTESKRLGTAGALSLMKDQIDGTFIVCNGDVVTNFDFSTLLGEHEAAGNDLSIVSYPYKVNVPYGVIDHSTPNLHVEEKPTYDYPICSGINIISDKLLSKIPEDTFFDMPQLYELALKTNNTVGVLEAEGYWSDIGSDADYKRVNLDMREKLL